MIACDLKQCPFNYKKSCRNMLTGIDENGMCTQIWRKGQKSPYAFEPVEECFMRDKAVEEIKPTKAEPQKEIYHQITIDEYIKREHLN